MSTRTLSIPWSTSTAVAASIQLSGVSEARDVSVASAARRLRGLAVVVGGWLIGGDSARSPASWCHSVVYGIGC